jgi:hypothetical protein
MAKKKGSQAGKNFNERSMWTYLERWQEFGADRECLVTGRDGSPELVEVFSKVT